MAKRDGLSTSKHVCHHPFRQRRHDSAAKMATERAARSAKQQMALLDQRFGPGQGAKKERARLQARIDADEAEAKATKAAKAAKTEAKAEAKATKHKG